ncbi:A24 family peptidase [Massilia niastensis]|uniref:A24 family peptidase n=1 Tax=Massilia niastensis TaxID=544911 RepID=UPI000364CA62|nr:prepilin peptidase [Massilia niastensis]
MMVAPYLDTLLLLMVTAAAINDLASRRIPNLLLLAGALGALCLHLLSPAPLSALLAWLGGAATGLLVFLPFYLVRGMAAGDVKMMAAVGAFTGPREALAIAVLAWCAGGVMALLIIVCKGRLRLALSNLWAMLRPALLRLPPGPSLRESAGSMPYGVAIAAGTLAVLAGRYG